MIACRRNEQVRDDLLKKNGDPQKVEGLVLKIGDMMSITGNHKSS